MTDIIVRVASHDIWRCPHEPQQFGELLAFCTQNASPGGWSAAMVARLLGPLTSGPSCIVDLFGPQGRVLVAAIVDTLAQPADVVQCEILGEASGHDRAAATGLVLDAACSVARTAGRLRVQSEYHHPIDPAVAEVLHARGHRLVERTLLLERAALEPFAVPALPAGWAWADLDQAGVNAFCELTTRAFAEDGIPLLVPGADDWRRSLLATRPRPRLLYDGETLIGIVRVAHTSGEEVGEVGTIARHPGHRGRAVGPQLLAEAIRLLREAGAKTLRLGVDNANEHGLRLYRPFGFEVVLECGTYSGAAADLHG